MSILSDINKTINDTDMLLWYNEEYIPFVVDHIDDVVELQCHNKDCIYYYMSYIPLDYHPKDLSCTRESCIEWLLNNDKIRCIVSTDDNIDGNYCYSGAFLEDSRLIRRIFNANWLKIMQQVAVTDNYPKNTMPHMPYYVDSDSMTDPTSRPYTWTVKVDYSKDMKPELAKVYYPIS